MKARDKEDHQTALQHALARIAAAASDAAANANDTAAVWTALEEIRVARNAAAAELRVLDAATDTDLRAETLRIAKAAKRHFPPQSRDWCALDFLADLMTRRVPFSAKDPAPHPFVAYATVVRDLESIDIAKASPDLGADTATLCRRLRQRIAEDSRAA